VELFFGDYQPYEDLSAILEEKSGKTTNGLSGLPSGRFFTVSCPLRGSREE
jgi:hypothetical protein